jgi:hypothetical protein
MPTGEADEMNPDSPIGDDCKPVPSCNCEGFAGGKTWSWLPRDR